MPYFNALYSSFFLRNVLFKKVSFQSFAIKNNLVDTFVEKASERINKTGSSQVGAISKAQKYLKNDYWKHLEKLFFSKKIV